MEITDRAVAPDRSRQPEVVIPQNVGIMNAELYGSPAGVRIYSLRAAGYGVVRVSFVFRAGSAWQTVPFCASATANNLSEGSRNMTAVQIAERLDYYGSYFDVSIDRDWSVVTFVCLTRFFDDTMALAKEILLEPAFPEDELRVYCDKSRQNLAINRTKVDFVARELFGRSIYGASHPYGVSSPESAYDTLSRDDVRGFYGKFYTAANCFVVVSGDVDDKKLETLARFVGELPTGAAVADVRFPEPAGVARAEEEFPKAVQSAIRVGRVLFPRGHADFIGMQVVAMALGGYFGSRLVRTLREEHGYTYGAYSAMVNFDRSGYIAMATEVGAQFTDAALEDIMAEVEKLRREEMPAEELALVKNIMAGEVMRIMDGPFGVADVTIENLQNGFDNGYITSFIEQVRGITPQRVRELARRYLAPEDLTTVVVGARR